MKKIISFIIFFLVTTNLFCQIDSTKVSFISYWSIGDSYNYKITKISQQWKDTLQTKDEKQEYTTNFKVIDSTENSYTILWSYENDFTHTFKIPEELLEKFSKYEQIGVKYKTSDVGALLEILNWEEVGLLMNNMFDDIVNVIGKDDKDVKEKLKQSMEPLKKLYSSKSGVEQLVLKELQYFHFPMGLEYDITKPIFYDDQLPNMFGGNPINVKAKLVFENVNFDDGFCIIKQEMKLNTDDTKDYLLQFFKKLQLPESEFEEKFKTAVYQINDNNTFEYYFNPGIPHRIETNREVYIDIEKEKAKRIDKIIIELIYNE